jgi:hypothetical protein
MTRNSLEDLNNHLFEQLERLNDDDLSPDQIDQEIKRANGMTRIAETIIQNGKLALEASEFVAEYGAGRDSVTLPKMLREPER